MANKHTKRCSVSLIIVHVCAVAQSCPTLCNTMDCSLPGSSVQADYPGKNIEVGCHALLQGIFPTQDLNPGLPHCRQILYHLSHQGSREMPKYSEASLHTSQNDHHQKNLQTINAGEDMETRQPSRTAGGNLIDTAIIKNSMEIS